MKVFAIDPGNEQSAYCIMDDQYNLYEFAKWPNKQIMEKLCSKLSDVDLIVIERMMSYGMPVGAEVFISCEWIGRFAQEAEKKKPVEYVYRKDEKLYMCGSPKATDSNIRHALIERFAKFDTARGTGTKKNPDFFYGVTKDVWSSIAIATTKLDMIKEKEHGKAKELSHSED